MALNFDIVIIGGSPAGLTAALMLTRCGYNVAVLERSGYDDFRAGEILSPSAVAALRQAGFSKPPDHLAIETCGILSCWDRPRLDETDYLYSPLGVGWNVARPGFDKWMSDCVAKAGANVQTRSPVRKIVRRGHAWSVETRLREFRAKTIVLATGRGTLKLTESDRMRRLDHHVGLVMYGAAADMRVRKDARLLVEAAPEGWWYSAGLPDDRVVFGHICTASDAPSKFQRCQFFLNRLQDAPFTADRFKLCDIGKDVLVAPASAQQRQPCVGEGWARIGQAAFALDPLSGSGWAFAIASAARLAETIEQAQKAFPDYARWLASSVETYQTSRPGIYTQALERFGSEFWRRAVEA